MAGTWHASKGLERVVHMIDYIDVYNGEATQPLSLTTSYLLQNHFPKDQTSSTTLPSLLPKCLPKELLVQAVPSPYR